MNEKMLERMRSGKAFIAALDQSGGSTPKALRNYGIEENEYSSEEEMFDLVHQMRTRIITNEAFTSDRILAAILFRRTMNSQIEGKYSAEYLWEEKGIVPILKVDQGLADLEDGVQLMKPIEILDEELAEAKEHGVFGTKMRSVIKAANPEGIRKIVDQQFDYGKKIFDAGLVPILEPEVDIHLEDKAEAEDILLKEIMAHMEELPENYCFMFKLTLPTQANLYVDLIAHPQVLRVVALSGGYTTEEANERLAQNHGMIASFSRALLNNLDVHQSDEEFTKALQEAEDSIYEASMK